jgi:hypothetical protein
MRATVTALNVHPVKSCRAVAAACADVTPGGLAVSGVRDREWMIVDADGRFVTQRELPRLALIGVYVADGTTTLTVPGHGTVTPDVDGPPRNVRVWSADVRGLDGGDEAAATLSAYLGRALRIVRFDDSRPRTVNPLYAGAGVTTLYADGYPVLVIGQASLDDLNERLRQRGAKPVPMNRFRPNVVIDGLEPHDEDHLDTIVVGDVVLRPVKPCVRCEVTTTDQASARRSDEPLVTLSSYRHDARLSGVTFGMNAIVVDGAGSSIAVGDEARVAYRF